MKTILLFLSVLMLSISFQARAQPPATFVKTIARGDQALATGDFQRAINMYQAAALLDQSQREITTERLNSVYKRIDNLRINAINAQKLSEKEKLRADSALAVAVSVNEQLAQALEDLEREKLKTETAARQAISAKLEADTAQMQAKAALLEAEAALQKAEKLINAFYFYEDRFAVAYNSEQERYYFIDKMGRKVEKLGEWKNVNPFDGRIKGFALVQNSIGQEFMLDTLGNTYYVERRRDGATNFPFMDLSTFYYSTLPWYFPSSASLQGLIIRLNSKRIKNLSKYIVPDQLKFLHLVNSNIKSLPRHINQFENLIHLNLSGNQLKKLPAEIRQLTCLKALDLSGNPIPETEKEQIRSLVPNSCRVIF